MDAKIETLDAKGEAETKEAQARVDAVALADMIKQRSANDGETSDKTLGALQSAAEELQLQCLKAKIARDARIKVLLEADAAGLFDGIV